jgi:hypothetical protein
MMIEGGLLGVEPTGAPEGGSALAVSRHCNNVQREAGSETRQARCESDAYPAYVFGCRCDMMTCASDDRRKRTSGWRELKRLGGNDLNVALKVQR